MNATAAGVASEGTRSTSRIDAFEHWVARTFNLGSRARVRLYDRYMRNAQRNIDLKTATETMYRRYQREGDLRRAIWRRVLNAFRDGKQFSEAMARYLPPVERMLISVGEKTGRVSEAFAHAIFVTKGLNSIKAALRRNLVYPAVLFVLFGALLWAVAFKIIPLMDTLAPLEKWPLVSRVLKSLAEFVRAFWPVILVAIPVVLGATLWALPRWTGRLRSFFDRWIPPFNIHREYNAATFMISLSSLADSGQPIDAAVKDLSVIASPWLRAHLVQMQRRLRDGATVSAALNTGLLDKELAGDLEDYDNANALTLVLASIGKDVIEQSIERIEAYAATTRVLMMFLVAGGIILTYSGLVFLVLRVVQDSRAFG